MSSRRNGHKPAVSEARLLDELAQAFLERLRKGERPTVTEYVQGHPELADRIRELFPTLLVIEDIAPTQPKDRR